jgi:hypothetical protein
MKMVCANCDLGLKRSDCSDAEYVECECRRWMIEAINREGLDGFMHVLDDALMAVFDNRNDFKNNKIRMISDWSRSLVE